ncbi:MAG: hypothetical protein ACJ780_31565 [Solirubrobacteraceae bacterium]|jgi:hypothetical protein
MSDESWMNDPEWNAYVTHVRSSLIPMLENTALTISLAPDDPKGTDIKFAIELGLSIMLDKPIIVVLNTEAELPPMLAKIAHAVVRGNIDNPATQAELMAAITSIPEMEGSDD